MTEPQFQISRPPAFDGIELRSGSAVTEPYPRHWHEEYQLCLIEGGGGWLDYRRGRHETPKATLFVVHPGEAHSNEALQARGCTFRSMYLPVEVFRRVGEQLQAGSSEPFFSRIVVDDDVVIETYRALFASLSRTGAELEAESSLLHLSELLIRRAAEARPAGAAPAAKRQAVLRVKELLVDRAHENVSLSELAAEAGLSRFHLNRLFRRQVGMPPHAFQVQARVSRAKRLLGSGTPIAEAAALAGFSDQSHLTRCFRRLVMMTPAQYARQSKNVQDGTGPPSVS